MTTGFALLDWLVIAGYLLILLAFGWFSKRNAPQDARDYFLGGNRMSLWVVAVSVLATTQSAATFLGGPDQGFRGDFSYVAANLGAVIAAIFVARVLIPKFYAMRAATVYELLGVRFGETAMRAAGGFYLIGRVFASGARLYLAAIAVSMILYSNIEPASIIAGSFIMMMLGFVITFFGGIRSVIWSDLLQFVIYTASAVTVMYFLLTLIPLDGPELIAALENAPDGQDKLRFFNLAWDFSDPFALISILTGLVLLNIGNFGMDQDTTQRLLTCDNPREGGRALIVSSVAAVPVIFLFVFIGQLLHVFYERPELMAAGATTGVDSVFAGERITVFMRFILDEIPAGLKGLVTVGVIAASVSTINSGLNSMSSVIVQDFYRPWRESGATPLPMAESHYVNAGRVSMGLVGVALFGMSVLCFYWQRYTDMPLLEFALSVMVFAYSGLLGVFFTAVFNRRGSSRSAVLALFTGFIFTVLQQSYVVDTLGLPEAWKSTAFSWQLCVGTAAAFAVCMLGRSAKTPDSESNG
ncbi:MAG: sodium:solute symporter [Pseudomonadota bacterium]